MKTLRLNQVVLRDEDGTEVWFYQVPDDIMLGALFHMARLENMTLEAFLPTARKVLQRELKA